MVDCCINIVPASNVAAVRLSLLPCRSCEVLLMRSVVCVEMLDNDGGTVHPCKFHASGKVETGSRAYFDGNTNLKLPQTIKIVHLLPLSNNVHSDMNG